jgi:YVTN family beta-propeller protein
MFAKHPLHFLRSFKALPVFLVAKEVHPGGLAPSGKRRGVCAGMMLLASLCAYPAFANTIPVTNLADSGPGSLRAAIASASPGDTITFSVTGTITLASTLTITQDLTIGGPGASSLAISGNNAVQVFSISGGTVTISGVTIENGNAGSGYGGGIYNFGTVTLTNSTLSGNSANGGGGSGGGIYNYGTVTLTNSTLSGNSANFGGGIWNDHTRGVMMVGNSSISGNSATSGAGVYNGGTLTLSNSTFSGNSSTASGGGIYSDGGTVNVASCSFSGNSALNGGGLYIGNGTLTVTSSTISGNSVSGNVGGAGIYNQGTATLTNSTLSGNSARPNGDGGGIYNQGTATLTNSTLSGNSAGFSGGGISNQGTASLTNDTLSGNSASYGGGGIINYGTLTAKSSIVANGSSGGNCYFSAGTLTSQGHNLTDDGTCSTYFNQTGDLNSTPAGLGILQNNGGPTQTIALFSSSPAVDAIPAGSCTDVSGNSVTTDQRGVARPQGAACDIGAYELMETLAVEAWGYNLDGELGNGSFTTSSPYGISSPGAVSGLSGVVAVAGGQFHSLAVKSDGTVWAWGSNNYAQLGYAVESNSDTPGQVIGPGGSGFLTGVVAIAGGGAHSLALKSDGTVWAWGNNGNGQLGDGTTTTTGMPVQVSGLTGVVAIAGGGAHSLAVKSDGTVWAWGNNGNGQLGNGTFVASNTPVQVSGLLGVVAIAGGVTHSLALKSDGTVWAWGNNGNGQLGNGTFVASNTPVQASGLSGIVAIAADGIGFHSIALKSDGTVWAWGDNELGELGNGTFTESDTPVQVSGLSGVVAIAAGGYHSLTLMSDRTVWDWGANDSGELGNGSFATSPPEGIPLSAQVSGLNGVVAIAGGGGHSLVLVSPNSPPTATNVNIIGTPNVGQVLTGSYIYSDADGDLEGTSTFLWLRDGQAISGATSITYTVVLADLGHVITFQVTPVAQTGASPGSPVQSSGVNILNSPPTATNVMITGSPYVGQILMGSYTYSDVDGDLQGTSTFLWLRDGAAISGATGSTYTVVVADSGHVITFEVTPVALTGVSPGSPVQSSGVTILNSPPTATNVMITGTPALGQVLTGSYTYSDVDGDLQGVSMFQWLRNNIAIAGATSITYTIVSADQSTTLTFEVTPVAQTGTSPGMPVQSAGVVVPATQPPTIYSVSSTAFTIGMAGSFMVDTMGIPTPSLTEAGMLPSGVTFVDNGNGTGTLAGTPSAVGIFNISFTAANGATPNATQNFTLTVVKPSATVPVGTNPFTSAVNPVTNKIYVANQGDNTISIVDGATNSTTTVPVGSSPYAVAVNPVTNKIYVANHSDANVTVIDGATNSTTTIATGSFPDSIALNPATNKIYVPSAGDNTVTVIDGATNATTTVAVGLYPTSIAVNLVTNKIYVTNQNSNSVTVLDGATNSTTTVAVGIGPGSIAVNPVTNQIYVAGRTVTVIDGLTNAAMTVASGGEPYSVAVNPVTNKIYVADYGAGNVIVIDGATNATTTVAADTGPTSIAVNPTTNKIFVANQLGNDVTVIDGATNTSVTAATGAAPTSVAVNPVTDKIYVTNKNSGAVTVIDGASNTTAAVTAGSQPRSVAVNPVTNKIYVANQNSNNVTVIDGVANTTTTVAAGTQPFAVAVNPVTNNIYVDNFADNTVTVIDGATNSTTTVATGTGPYAVAVNPVTNQIYVANYDSSNVTVIDGATNNITTVAAGAAPNAVAVNTVTNKIYVANYYSNNVTVIDGATNLTTTVAGGAYAGAIAVNPVTNQIYLANYYSTVTVIDGVTNNTTTISGGSYEGGIAVNPATNKIYVTNYNYAGNSVLVIDGATNNTSTVTVGSNPITVAVDPVTNKIYVPNQSSNNITVIDGATNSTTTVAAGSTPFAVAVNPVTNQVYVPNLYDNTVTVLTEQQTQAIPLTTTISPLVGNQTSSPVPTFTFTGSDSFAPTAPSLEGLYFQLDTWQGPWFAAASTGTQGSFTGTAPTLSPGVHILYAYATDGQDASSLQTGGIGGSNSSPVLGNITAYLFLVNPSQPPAITSPSSVTFTTGVAGSFTVTTSGLPVPSLSETGALPGGVTFVDNHDGTGVLAGTPTTGGTFAISFTAANGVLPNATQPFTLTVNQPPAITSAASATFTTGVAGSFTVTTSGLPVPSLSETGTLPGGVTFVDNHDGTGVLAGTPTAGGTFAISFTAANGVLPNATQPFMLTVNQPPAITSGTSTTFAAGLAGSFTVTATGTPAPSLSESGVLPSGVTFNTATHLLSGTPAVGTNGTYNITFTASNGVGSNFVQNFSLSVVNAPVPTLTSVSPNAGVRGTVVPVTLTGTSFTATGTTVAVSGTGVTVSGLTVVNSTTITATFTIAAAATLAARNVTVTTPGGASNAQTFTVGPLLASISPNTGARGTSLQVTLTGSGLTGTTAITVSGGGVTVSGLTVVNDTMVMANFAIAAGAGLTVRNVSITTTPGGASNTMPFTIVNPPLPTLATVAPNTGVRGTAVPVTLTGTNFTEAGTTVAVSGGGMTVGAVTVVNATTATATFTISAGAALTARNVRVTTPGGTSGNVTFTVQGPTLTSISPSTSVRGTSVPVSLTGTNLMGATAVTTSGTGITCTGITSTATTVNASCAITAGATISARNVSVTTPIGTTNVLTGAFTVQGPTLTSISPSTGVRGTSVPVSLTGTNLMGATAVTISGTGITCTGITSTATTVNASCAITAGATISARNVSVTTPIGTTNVLTGAFTVQGPTLASISPGTGVRGTSVPVSLTGTNLMGATVVTISGGGVACTGITSTATTVNASCAITAGAAVGARNVSITTPIGTTNTLTGAFTVN